jgi:hypothetical protein
MKTNQSNALSTQIAIPIKFTSADSPILFTLNYLLININIRANSSLYFYTFDETKT